MEKQKNRRDKKEQLSQRIYILMVLYQKKIFILPNRIIVFCYKL